MKNGSRNPSEIPANFAVSELFTSIQGESSYSGRLCFFIRLAGCNLNCSWCDTQYAKSATESRLISASKIIVSAKRSGSKLVEITGGEPLLQKGLSELCRRLLQNNFNVIIETNGSLPIKSFPHQVVFILDCKCPSSGEADKMLFENFRYIKRKDEIKFVIADKHDYNYAKKIIEKHGLIDRTEKIFFSPLSDRLKAARLAEWMIADKSPAILATQLHKIIWGQDAKGR